MWPRRVPGCWTKTLGARWPTDTLQSFALGCSTTVQTSRRYSLDTRVQGLVFLVQLGETLRTVESKVVLVLLWRFPGGLVRQ